MLNKKNPAISSSPTPDYLQVVRQVLCVKFLGFLLFALLLTSCPTPDAPAKPDLSPGMGSITIRLADKVSRTILPEAPDLDHFTRFQVIFTYPGTAIVVDSESDVAINGNVLAAIVINTGTYDITVNAFAEFNGNEYCAATGIAEDVYIADGANKNETINLGMLLYEPGIMGLFTWNINLPNNLDFASIKIYTLDLLTEVGVRDLFVGPHSYELYSDVYQVIVELKVNDSPDSPLEIGKTINWYEILHIYPTLITHWPFTFSEDHFNRTHYRVTFNYNYSGSGAGPSMSVLSGDTFPEARYPVDPVRDGYRFVGWETNSGAALSTTMQIYEDITLYAKWVLKNLDIEIEFELPGNPLIISGLPATGPLILYRDAFSGGSKTLSVSDSFSNVHWYLNNETAPRYIGLEFTLDESVISTIITGTHFLTVEAHLGPIWYSRTIEIEVRDGLPPPTYNIGDVGPAGGIIFYVADGQDGRPNGFTVHGYGVDGDPGYFETYTAHYLEAAPENITGNLMWASNSSDLVPGLSQNSTEETDWVIGRGRMNTAIIVARGIDQDYTTPAASECVALRTGDKDDWFLPSRNELDAMYFARAASNNIAGLPTTGLFWSSSQYPSNIVWSQNFVNGSQDFNYKNGSSLVRAIRAF